MTDLLTHLETRRSSATLTLAEPGPDARTLGRLLSIAARVPDHGALTPWRFIVVEGEHRLDLARQMVAALADQQHAMSEAEQGVAAQKISKVFTIAPTIIVVVSRPVRGANIPDVEQVLSAGAVCMNLTVAASASGFGTNWVTGWAASHPIAHAVLGIAADETIAGIILIGTPGAAQPDRPRPHLDAIVRHWRAEDPSHSWQKD